MVSNTRIKNMLFGNKSDSEIFKEYWEANGFKERKGSNGEALTVPVQRLFNSKNTEILAKHKGSVCKTIASWQTKDAMTSTQVQTHVPLVFDPDILSIQKDVAPFLERVPTEGQRGYKAVYQRVDARDRPLGFRTEAQVLDLTNETASDITFEKEETDMVIWIDKVEISDFTQDAASHYMDVRDTTLGQRVAEFMQRKEQQILYGDIGLGLQKGGLGDSRGYDGLSTIFTAAGNSIDKSSITEKFIGDIKKEIHAMIQKENVSPSDLLVVCSWSMFDTLGTELQPGQTRFGATENTADIGVANLRIQGVPVLPTHNITLHQETEVVVTSNAGDNTLVVPNDYTDVLAADDEFDVGGVTLTVASTSYDSGDNQTTITVDALAETVNGETATFDIAGDDGDVFIVNTRAIRFRALAPFSAAPLARLGLADVSAIYEFGAFIERSAGNWGRYLKAYSI